LTSTSISSSINCSFSSFVKLFLINDSLPIVSEELVFSLLLLLLFIFVLNENEFCFNNRFGEALLLFSSSFYLKNVYSLLSSIPLTSSDVVESCIADLDRDIVDASFVCLIGLGS